MSPQTPPGYDPEWALAAMALRSIFARDSDPLEVREFRITLTRETLPGLAVIEWEFITHDGFAVGGGAL